MKTNHNNQCEQWDPGEQGWLPVGPGDAYKPSPRPHLIVYSSATNTHAIKMLNSPWLQAPSDTWDGMVALRNYWSFK